MRWFLGGNSKTSKNLITEFVLIVTGVLTALGAESIISRIAEDRLTDRYLDDLTTGLRRDSARLTFWEEFNDLREAALDTLDAFLAGEDVAAETVYEALYAAVTPFSEPIQRDVYDDLVSTGRIGLIRDVDLRRRIVLYYYDFFDWGAVELQKAIPLGIDRAFRELLWEIPIEADGVFGSSEDGDAPAVAEWLRDKEGAQEILDGVRRQVGFERPLVGRFSASNHGLLRALTER